MTTTVLEKPARASGTLISPVRNRARSEHRATRSERNFGIAKQIVVAIRIMNTSCMSVNMGCSVLSDLRRSFMRDVAGNSPPEEGNLLAAVFV